MQTTDKQLKRKFNSYIKKYQKWCLKSGYDSRDEIVLLWYFNRKHKAIKKNDGYCIVYQGIDYELNSLITIFKNKRNGKK